MAKARLEGYLNIAVATPATGELQVNAYKDNDFILVRILDEWEHEFFSQLYKTDDRIRDIDNFRNFSTAEQEAVITEMERFKTDFVVAIENISRAKGGLND
jgi:hypothetical protein